jgi:hypothetical protein
VLGEAWELVARGHLDAGDFRDLVFGNALRLFGEANPAFFEGTAVADAARKALRASGEGSTPGEAG